MMLDGLDQLQVATAPARHAVITHPLYAALDSEAAVVTFTEHHVWAVLDFMSLLTSLQRGLTCVTVPWVPVGHTTTRRLVNELKVAEESDDLGGVYGSHYEMYLAAMIQAGADTGPVEKYAALIADGVPVGEALSQSGPPRAAAKFVGSTFRLIGSGPLHAQAAAFAFGREALIPEMFGQLDLIGSPRLAILRDYVERHVELDAEHGPMALEMVTALCGSDARRWEDCEAAVLAALESRRLLWDGTRAALD